MKSSFLTSNLDLNLSITSYTSHNHNHKLLHNHSRRSLYRFSRENRISSIRFRSNCRIPKSFCDSSKDLGVGDEGDRNLIGGVRKVLFNLAVGVIGVGLVFGVDSPALAESLTFAFPVSRSVEVNRVQRTLIETWGLIRESFIDPSFNHQDWDLKLQQTLVEMFPLKSADAAYSKIRGMVSSLGDPFTRIVSPKGNDTLYNPSFREVNLPREDIKLSPISSAIIPHKTPDGHLSRTGYVRLSAFSQSAASDMEKVIHRMEDQDVHSYILDLRNNPGGLVRAGLDVAQMWLDGEETLVYTIDRDGHIFPINMVDGHALTHDPLVILVNEGSASASEILAGALHDNGRAMLIGNRTFGKGKIQSVTELHDGSALFVTVAKYLSPLRHEIDKVGIAPDVQCTADMLNAAKEPVVRSSGSSLEADSCIMVAEQVLDIQESLGTAS